MWSSFCRISIHFSTDSTVWKIECVKTVPYQSILQSDRPRQFAVKMFSVLHSNWNFWSVTFHVCYVSKFLLWILLPKIEWFLSHNSNFIVSLAKILARTYVHLILTMKLFCPLIYLNRILDPICAFYCSYDWSLLLCRDCFTTKSWLNIL